MSTSLHGGIMQPLRFYEDIQHQNRNRRAPGANENVFKLLCPNGYLLPFQIKRPASPAPIDSVTLFTAKGTVAGIITTNFAPDQLVLISLDSTDYIVHFGTEQLSGFGVNDGDYYLRLVSGGVNYYSEVFTYRTFDKDLLTLDGCALTKITYWATCDIAETFYRTVEAGYEQYKTVFYLDTIVHAPEWEHDDEGSEDGEGNFTADTVKSTKTYMLEGIYPEYFLDALNTLPQYMGRNSSVEISTAYGYTCAINQVLIDKPDYIGTAKVWARTKISFSVGFFFTTNCCDSAGELFSGCIRNAKSVVAYIVAGSSDWLNFEYFNEELQTVQPLIEDDLVMVLYFNGEEQVRRFTGTGFSPPLIDAQGTAYQDENFLAAGYTHPAHHIYYYNLLFTTYEWNKPTIQLIDNGSNSFTVKGLAWLDCWIEVKTYDLEDGFTTVATGTSLQYKVTGLTFTNSNNAEYVLVLAKGVQGCFLGQSDNKYLPSSGLCLIGTGIIGTCVISN